MGGPFSRRGPEAEAGTGWLGLSAVGVCLKAPARHTLALRRLRGVKAFVLKGLACNQRCGQAF